MMKTLKRMIPMMMKLKIMLSLQLCRASRPVREPQSLFVA